ncbi:ATP-binding protein [Streptomyces spinoverrucosus]|uniref:ATP-binding protein n=1 Tax=Streptomyces spinoverrucosus TaxID=284043 RepID=UPI0018C413E8|nr:ATP-binding protein [Streptomyces spinoverrucosus]MBG0850324.1 ATP-binding protein [Streptomyces spinoverrucosus]MBG0857774.1 ATP-binding protein [Streptomyces spinoverrucosus]
MGETVPGPAASADAGRVERAVVVRRLLAVDREGGLSALHVRITAGLAGVSERTVWRWLEQGRRGRVEARPRQGGFVVGDALWEVLTQAGGNVAELRRRMLRAQDEGVLQRWGVEVVPSLATLHRAIKDELRAGRVLPVARAASGRVEPSRYDRALAELGFADGKDGPPVVDGPAAGSSGTSGEGRTDAAGVGVRSGGVRLYAPGARLVSTRQAAGVVEAVGHTVAARGIGCVYGDTGLGKTVAVEQALHLLPGRVPVWRAVVGVRPGLPQVRAALCEALGLPSGALTHRAGPADQALAGALAEPGVLFLDDAQRLTTPVLDYLRQLWDSPGCAAALVLCGAGSERALARAAAMRSRVLTWHQVTRLDASQVPQTLSLFHPVWEDADPADLVRADEQTARGNFRTWAKITSHVCAARGHDPGTRVGRDAIDQACARLGPYP